jgi:thioredoxin 1
MGCHSCSSVEEGIVTLSDGVVRELSRETYGELVTESSSPVIIDFWGPQCGPCLALEPTFVSLADSLAEQITFFRVEAPKNRMLCVDAKVMSLPTFLCVRGGVEVSRLTGDVSSESLTRWVHEQCERAEGGK